MAHWARGMQGSDPQLPDADVPALVAAQSLAWQLHDQVIPPETFLWEEELSSDSDSFPLS